MKIAAKLVCLVLPLLFLPGCKRVQLAGPVVDAEVWVDLLNQRGAGYQSTTSTSSSDVITLLGVIKWTSLTPEQKLLWLGDFDVDPDRLLADQLYLVQARGGRDVDVDHDHKSDLMPTEVAGEWHAIMRASDLAAVGAMVSPLTEAAYQYVRGQIGYVSDEALLELLDQFAMMVVADVNGDGRIDYTDVLHWSRSLTPGKYLGDIALVDTLVAAITSDAPAYILEAAAAGVAAGNPVEPVPPGPVEGTELGGTLSGNQLWSMENSPYVVRSQLNVTGDLTVEPGVEVTGGGRISVEGDLNIDGLPRQRVTLNNVSFTVYSWGTGAENAVRNADISGGVLDLRIQRLMFEENDIDRAQIRVSNIVKSADSAAVFRYNIQRNGSVTFVNAAPVRPAFTVTFVNNLFLPEVGATPSLESRWEGPVANLQIQNNSFHKGMTFLRGSASSVMDIRNNYWFEYATVIDMIDDIIPDNEGPLEQPIIRYLPMLSAPDPATPGAP